ESVWTPCICISRKSGTDGKLSDHPTTRRGPRTARFWRSEPGKPGTDGTFSVYTARLGCHATLQGASKSGGHVPSVPDLFKGILAVQNSLTRRSPLTGRVLPAIH